jgi:hypothetical protein
LVLPAEESLTIESEEASLEARAVRGSKIVVVAHPHPMYGGTMDSHVVRAVCEMAHEHGLGYLRFNFRGVGASTGTHDSGLGEAADLKAAVRKAGELGETVLVSGYSFGSWVATRVPPPMPLLLIAPPTEQYDFSGSDPGSRPVHMIAATDDPSCLILYVKDLEAQGARVRWIDGADHIFTGKYVLLRNAIGDALDDLGLGKSA